MYLEITTLSPRPVKQQYATQI